MEPEQTAQPSGKTPETGGVPPRLIGAGTQGGGGPPEGIDGVPPLLRPEMVPSSAPARRIFAGLLSLCLGLYLADAALSLLGQSLVLLFGVNQLAMICGLVSVLALLAGLIVYGLMGFAPMIPKRLFLPVVLFNPVAVAVFVPVLICAHRWMEQAGWIIAFCQLALGLGILHRLQHGFRFNWRLVPESWLGTQSFSWRHLCTFLLVNLLVLLPAFIGYLAACAVVAVHHSTSGFLALRPTGLTVQVRKYVRNDGKTVLLVPMAHIGEADFYRKLSRSFPTNSVVLMEGVTDDKNLLTNQISYRRMAATLGLSEQQQEFKPVQVETVRADVDVAEFSTNTIGLLNLAMLFHARGVNPETISALLRFSAPPHIEEELEDDLVRKRNEHVLGAIQGRLAEQKPIVVPWGVAHMPGIAAGITASGFSVAEAQDYIVIRFHFGQGSKHP